MGHSLSAPTVSSRVPDRNKSRKKRILVVDDEPDTTMAITSFLKIMVLKSLRIMILY